MGEILTGLLLTNLYYLKIDNKSIIGYNPDYRKLFKYYCGLHLSKGVISSSSFDFQIG